MNSDFNRNSDSDLKTKLPYKELLGSLMFIMMGTRPGICFSVGCFGRFQDSARDEHFKHLLLLNINILKYFKTTIDCRLYFEYSNDNFQGYANSDFEIIQ